MAAQPGQSAPLGPPAVTIGHDSDMGGELGKLPGCGFRHLFTSQHYLFGIYSYNMVAKVFVGGKIGLMFSP
jgi:hypothetical protein